jgi:uncharacterized protein (UPF0332 family)
MPLHHELLNLARELVDRNPAAPVVADLRRGISTAYYALFHLLVDEATTRLVAVASLRPRIARSFDHKIMRMVCQDYGKLTSNSAGQKVPQEIRSIADEFIVLQLARHEADYDTSAIITQARADTEVLRAELAFLDWARVQFDPAAETFLAELLCRGIPKR